MLSPKKEVVLPGPIYRKLLTTRCGSQGNLQYTLEEKYLKRQQRYYFEAGEDRFLLQLQDLRLLNLNLGHDSPVLRRPVFAQPPDQGTAAPHMWVMLPDVLVTLSTEAWVTVLVTLSTEAWVTVLVTLSTEWSLGNCAGDPQYWSLGNCAGDPQYWSLGNCAGDPEYWNLGNCAGDPEYWSLGNCAGDPQYWMKPG